VREAKLITPFFPPIFFWGGRRPFCGLDFFLMAERHRLFFVLAQRQNKNTAWSGCLAFYGSYRALVFIGQDLSKKLYQISPYPVARLDNGTVSPAQKLPPVAPSTWPLRASTSSRKANSKHRLATKIKRARQL
jgi:hypothetical protein